MMTMGIMLFAVILSSSTLVLFAVVMLAGMHKESRIKPGLFMSQHVHAIRQAVSKPNQLAKCD